MAEPVDDTSSFSNQRKVVRAGPGRIGRYVADVMWAGTAGLWASVQVVWGIGLLGLLTAILAAGVVLAAVFNVGWLFAVGFALLFAVALVGGYRVWSETQHDYLKAKADLDAAANAERRSGQRARAVVANALDEVIKVLIAAVKEIVGLDYDDWRQHPGAVDPHLPEIDAFVTRTEVLERLKSAIDDLAALGYADLAGSSEALLRLQSIRAQIGLGSDPTRHAALNVFAACVDGELQVLLRQM